MESISEIAMQMACPFCGAAPGVKCVSRHGGMDFPRYKLGIGRTQAPEGRIRCQHLNAPTVKSPSAASSGCVFNIDRIHPIERAVL